MASPALPALPTWADSTKRALSASCPLLTGALTSLLALLGDPVAVRVPTVDELLGAVVDCHDALADLAQALADHVGPSAPASLSTQVLEECGVAPQDAFEAIVLYLYLWGRTKASASVGHVDGPFLQAALPQLNAATSRLGKALPPRVRAFWLRTVVDAACAPDADRQRAWGHAGTKSSDLPSILVGLADLCRQRALRESTSTRAQGGRAAAGAGAGAASAKSRIDDVSEDHVRRVLEALTAVGALCRVVSNTAAGAGAGAGAGDTSPPSFDPADIARRVAAANTKNPRRLAAATRCAAVQVQITTLQAMARFLKAHEPVLRGASALVWQALWEYLMCAQGKPVNGSIEAIESRAQMERAEPVRIVQGAQVPAATLAALEEFAGRRVLSATARSREQAFLGALPNQEVAALLRAAADQAGAKVEAALLDGTGGPVLDAMLAAVHGLTALTAAYEFQTVVPEQLDGCAVVL
jgi:hypothetical protein